ncbi:MAG: glycosyltransferase family 4 protein [Chloroflexales bacterium]|nr:glycosyltransferase family 4 protein [Chloroflexales bacterium]
MQRLQRAGQQARQLQARIYHLHDPELIPLGLWLKAVTGAIVIFDCHENNIAYLRQKQYLRQTMRHGLTIGMALMEHLAARCFDAIITADQGVATLYRRRYQARRVVTLHNFPQLSLFESWSAQYQPRRSFVFDLVYHGTIPRYHLEIAFAVAEVVRSRGVLARWLFFGRCPEAEWAQAEVRRRKLCDHFVIDPTAIPHEQVADRVRQARIGFIPLPDLPKFQHNIPTKLFEFMALEMPVVLSDLPPSRPFVGDGVCALMVKPDDPAAYADAIIQLLRDPERCRTMGVDGRRRVEYEYNWEQESNKLLDLYADLLAA